MKRLQIVTFLGLIFISFAVCSCNWGQKRFNEENSDEKAIEIVDQVIETMGGEKGWNNTRHFRWNFFDARGHFWDKKTGNIRIESLKDDLIILMNIDKMEGKVLKDGQEVDNPDSVEMYMEKGRNWWINDSYWLVMPFKLKDPGVSLRYIGQNSTEAGEAADVVQLTFEEVGVTPENKYWVYIDKDKKLVTQWAFYRNANQEQPDFVLPWNNYQKYGEILLSGDRGKGGALTNIAVYDKLPDEVYSSFEAVKLN